MGVGLVTGSEPFAKLPDNPAMTVLPYLDGKRFGDIEVKAVATPVSLKGLPTFLPELIEEYRPDFMVSLGLALGAPAFRVETIGTNMLSFGVPDNEGERPLGGAPLERNGPAARRATWDHAAIVNALLHADLPAVTSFSAGTHMCNATLYTALGTMEKLGLPGPCGFFHLPYLPSQVARFLREAPAEGDRAPVTDRVLASMSLDDQLRGLTIMLETVAAQVGGSPADK
ncbi:MAG: pyroglutamyl-peptidase I [Pseudomonadota bacterium]